MVDPIQAVTTRAKTDLEEITELKRYTAQVQAERAERQAAQATEQARKDADGALGRYRGKVQQHQKQWYKNNGYRWNQKEWEKAWAKDGAGAMAELMPFLAAYDTATQNELRLAAERGPQALEKKKNELLGRDKSGSAKDKILDGIVTGDFNVIARESPALRRAAQTYQIASAAWSAVQNNPDAPGHREAQAAFLKAQADYLIEWSNFVDTEIEKGLKAGKSPQQIGQELKSLFGEQMTPFIDMKITAAEQKPKIDQWIAGYRANPGAYNLTDAERKLFETDPTTVAVMKMSGVTLGPAKMSEAEKRLASASPILFIQMKSAGVTFTDQIGEPSVTINGKAVELTWQEKAAYKDGGVVGLWCVLRNRDEVSIDQGTQNLLLGSVPARLAATKARVAELITQGKDLEAMAVLRTNMNAALSAEERQALFIQAGMPHFGPGTNYWDRQIDKQLALGDDDNPMTIANNDADKVGRWMQDVAKNAPPELVNMMLTTVKSRYTPEWLTGNGARAVLSKDGTDFYKGLSVSVAIADQIPGNNRTLEFARWLASMPVGRGSLVSLMLGENGDPIRFTIEHGFGTGLTDALMEQLKAAPDQANGASYEMATTMFPNIISDAKGRIREQEWFKEVNDQYRAFEQRKGEMLQTYFDKFLNDPIIGAPQKTENGPALRNFVGRALGLNPTQYHDQAKNNVTNVDWYGEKTDERKVIDLVVAWIMSVGGSGATVTATPFIYADNNEGVAPGALFKLKRADGTEVIIDGSQADDAYRSAAAQGQKIDLKDPDENVYVKWKFDRQQ
jgi:hypothetical protein